MSDNDFRAIVREELAPIRAELDSIKIKVSGIPLMATTLHELRDDVRELRRETRMLKTAVNDMARVSITGGEVEALHDELDRLANDQIDIKARLALLEGKEHQGPGSG